MRSKLLLLLLAILILDLVGCVRSSVGKDDGETTETAADGHMNSSVLTVTADLKKTGQTKSYNADGIVVEWGMIKDDGYYQTGIMPNYTRSNDTVTDRITGLMWQDNTDADVASAASRDSLQAAIDYCSTLELGGYTDWRLPIVEELETIVDYGRFDPSIDPVFRHTSSSLYWSSSVFAGDKLDAWSVSFGKALSFYVRCVRGGAGTERAEHFKRSGSIVSDGSTGLMWQDNSEAADPDQRKVWEEALSYCEELELEGYTDWRLPNIRELKSIAERTAYNPTVNGIFQNVASSWYWSSTTYAGFTPYAWFVSFYSGLVNNFTKTDLNYVRCVRSEQ